MVPYYESDGGLIWCEWDRMGIRFIIIIDGMDRFYPPPILPISVRHFEKREIAGIGGTPSFLSKAVFFLLLC